MMRISRKTTIVLILAGIIAVVAGVYLLVNNDPVEDSLRDVVPTETTETATTTASQQVIGTSVEGRDIQAHTFGSGPTHLLFVGGIHGGYEWNSVLLSYQFIDYLEANPEVLPEGLTVSVIPSANPDGVYDVIGTEGRFSQADVPADEGSVGNGRFNANGVDLNRNFDCNWAPESSWRGQTVSAGSGPFSEPEAQAIRDFVQDQQPDAAIFWHSQANTVYASECNNGVLPETVDVMNAYAQAAGYNAVESFDAYPITGDVEGWLASIGIPALTVELETHETVEWERNLAGVQALFDYYDQQK